MDITSQQHGWVCVCENEVAFSNQTWLGNQSPLSASL